MQDVEKRLSGASSAVLSRLEEEQQELRRIQSTRALLETQLRELQRAAEEEGGDGDDDTERDAVGAPVAALSSPAPAGEMLRCYL